MRLLRLSSPRVTPHPVRLHHLLCGQPPVASCFLGKHFQIRDPQKGNLSQARLHWPGCILKGTLCPAQVLLP